jgi:hypothetical protein
MSFSERAVVVSERKFYARGAFARIRMTDDLAPSGMSAAAFRHDRFDWSPDYCVELICRSNGVDQAESFRCVQWLSEPMRRLT